ncbi:hypothetical protein T03_16996 [Trichinella britovi]|uniref:Uncharacterized protein n=1 Tax=Trichinella britovi TaxID=45882 RepID=A0A0V1CZ17_TRIBR|nr:hypothetical protein T03_6603 [Trichinella britovi]KRY54484.1 hypothetical protein T03_16996 [Trichinella britovi]
MKINYPILKTLALKLKLSIKFKLEIKIKCYAKSFFCFAARMAIVRSFAMQSAKVIPPIGRLAGSCSTFELRQLLHFH